MPTLSDGKELTYQLVVGPGGPGAYAFYLTPPGGTPTQFDVILNDEVGPFGRLSLQHIDVFDGYFALSTFTSMDRNSEFTYLDTRLYANDGTLLRSLRDEAAHDSGTFGSIAFQDPDNLTITWTRADNYFNGNNTQYGVHQVILEDGVRQPDTFVNHTPSVADLSFSVARGAPLQDVKFSFSDPDFDLLKFIVVDKPDHGTLTQSTHFDSPYYPFPEATALGGGPNWHRDSLEGNHFSYTPAAGFVGTDTFKVYGTDGQASSAIATISLTVTLTVTPGAPEYITLTNGPDIARYFASNHPVLVAAKGGNDDISGSRFDDSINGGTGNDLLRGELGRDKITGGEGADRVLGGGGNDTFNFVAGDLAEALQTPGRYDHIVDFHGAGNSGPGEQDFLRFSGFGDDATLSFARYGSADHLKQLYAVTDPDNPDNSGFVLIQMADGPSQLAHGDYMFV